ncbi:hypothetical protein EGR_10128 [Echinococcus granulosus]|uniref:Uncharacterized protein n=1 Tax=Echinococcus granulosus TaxID=6210 RepID=W6U1N9_ECHGR|nr:hypothetical protein EGR_10128 [Echinococcus granulosus]EUB55010.1 hypothetical protein EGR_10128 [Echinococcus granulosus]
MECGVRATPRAHSCYCCCSVCGNSTRQSASLDAFTGAFMMTT